MTLILEGSWRRLPLFKREKDLLKFFELFLFFIFCLVFFYLELSFS